MFFSKPFPRKFSDEMNKYIDELEKIAKEDDFLSERPIGPFDRDCRHIRAHYVCRMIYFIYEDVGSNDCFPVAQFCKSGIGT